MKISKFYSSLLELAGKESIRTNIPKNSTTLDVRGQRNPCSCRGIDRLGIEPKKGTCFIVCSVIVSLLTAYGVM